MKLFSRCRLKPQYNMRNGGRGGVNYASGATADGASGCSTVSDAGSWTGDSISSKIWYKNGVGYTGLSNTGFTHWGYAYSGSIATTMPYTTSDSSYYYFINSTDKVIMIHFGAFIIFMNPGSRLYCRKGSPWDGVWISYYTGISHSRQAIPCFVSFVYGFWDCSRSRLGVSDIRDIQNSSNPCVAILESNEQVDFNDIGPYLSNAWSKFQYNVNSTTSGAGVVAYRNPFGRTDVQCPDKGWTWNVMGIESPWYSRDIQWAASIEDGINYTQVSIGSAHKYNQWFMAPYIFWEGGSALSSCSWRTQNYPANVKTPWGSIGHPRNSDYLVYNPNTVGAQIRSSCGYSYASMGWTRWIQGSWGIGANMPTFDFEADNNDVMDQIKQCTQFVCNYIDAEEITA